ncbi:hypothetical protein ACFL03_14680 [Thermodesulfobacteriota bacterium]
MGSKYLIESKDGITTVRFSIDPGLDDICNAIDDVAENYLSELRLWDLSNGFSLTDAHLQKLAEYGKSKFLIPSKAAVVAPQDLAFGVARVHDVYREDEFLEQRVFRTEQEARAWLISQKQPK